MSPRRLLLLISFGAAVIAVLALIGWAAWRAWQSTPAYQFQEARARWRERSLPHYRLAVDYGTFIAQCHYDIEVRNELIVHTNSVTCLSNADTPMLAVEGIFERFERYVEERLCSSTGCYCDGTYVLKAQYDPGWGYPKRITTEFRRAWLDDVLHLKLGVQECFRSDPEVEKVEVRLLTPLP
jgi:hypothetical protein